jgi:hypothetical protein
MLSEIKKYAEKGFYIGIYPTLEHSGYQWISFVMIKGERNWLKGKQGCTMSAFPTIEEALLAATSYCDNYHEKKKPKR